MVKCPSCGKEIAGSGHEFGEEVKMACYECSCGTSVIVDKTLKKTRRMFGVKKKQKSKQP